MKPAPVPRGPSRRKREMAEIKETLDVMVASGELYVTPDGRYGLTAWNKSNTDSKSLSSVTTGALGLGASVNLRRA